MGNTIQMQVVTDAYAARISNLQMYDAVSRDILNRWTFPFVPDFCHRHNQDAVSTGRHNVYLSKDVSLARECKLVENVLLGSGTCVGSNTVISNSVIGRNCKIGNNVSIKGSYLWQNVTVEDNCTIDTSLLCDNVVVYDHVTTCPGCVLTTKVSVGPNVTVKPGTIAVTSLEDDFGDDDVDAADGGGGGEPVYGKKAKAFTYTKDTDDDEEDDQVIRQLWGLNIQSDSSDDDDDDESEKSSESGSPPESLPPDEPVYYTEMLDTVQRAKDENISSENLILEINSLKHAYNIQIKELTLMVVKALLQQPLSENPSLVGAEALRVLKERLTKHLPVLHNYIRNEEGQLQCLNAVEEFGSSGSQQMELVMKIVHFLYDSDILLEQIIVKWYKLPVDAGNHDDSEDEAELENNHAEVRKQVAPLIKWLEEADEESSEED